MKLFTPDEHNQLQYIGDYDVDKLPRRGEKSVEKRQMLGLFKRYKNTVIGVLIGLILGILLISIGFFKTLLLMILAAVGFVVGGFIDRNPIIMKFLSNLG